MRTRICFVYTGKWDFKSWENGFCIYSPLQISQSLSYKIHLTEEVLRILQNLRKLQILLNNVTILANFFRYFHVIANFFDFRERACVVSSWALLHACELLCISSSSFADALAKFRYLRNFRNSRSFVERFPCCIFSSIFAIFLIFVTAFNPGHFTVILLRIWFIIVVNTT